jgi:dipeptidyl aminopeptidase/acylaminoacyl peptidase
MSGNLVYVLRPRGSRLRQLVRVDRLGQWEPIAPPARTYVNLRVAPDGRRIVVGVEQGAATDVWTFDLSRATWSQLTFNGRSGVPIWTPDGSRVTFVLTSESGPQLYWKAADGSGPEERLSSEPGNPHSWNPDGRRLARTTGGVATVGLGILTLDGSMKTEPFLSNREGTEMAAPAFSPDGRWLAYVANESGRRQVYVRQFPATAGRWLVSSDGGIQPMWARNGRELFYRIGDKMMAVDVTTTPVFRAGTPRLLFEGRYEGDAVRANYDVMPDGHFIMIKATEQESTQRRLNIVLNWGEELKRRVTSTEQK